MKGLANKLLAMQMFALVVGSSVLNLSLSNPPERADAKPRTDANAALVTLNYDAKSGYTA